MFRCVGLLLCLLTVVSSLTDSGSDVDQIKVFSNLQDDRNVFDFLAPYPVGMNLTLTCNLRKEKPQWWEWDHMLCPNSSLNHDTGINTVKFTIDELSPRDHSRMLTCATGKTAKPVSVVLYVIDEMPDLAISHSRSSSSSKTSKSPATTLSCGARGVDRHLKLCWFRDNKQLKCQEEHISSCRGREIVSVDVTARDSGSQLVCRPQLRHGASSLGAAARSTFQQMFESAQKVVQILHTANRDEAEAMLASTAQSQEAELDVTNCSTVTLLNGSNSEGNTGERGYLMATICSSQSTPTMTEEEHHMLPPAAMATDTQQTTDSDNQAEEEPSEGFSLFSYFLAFVGIVLGFFVYRN